MKTKVYSISLLSLLLITGQAYSSTNALSDDSQTGKLGVMGGWSSGPYNHFDRKVVPFPLVIYEGSSFYLRGAEAGYKLFQSANDEITLSASLLPMFYKSSDAKTAEMKALDDRKMSGMAGATWTHNAGWGAISFSAKQRFTGNKEGYSLGMSYGYPLSFGKLSLIPSAGLEYSDRKLNNYYYGISGKESARSGYAEYNPGSGTNYYTDILVVYPLTSKIDISGGARVTRLSDEVVNSPMTVNRVMHSFLASVSYSF